MRLTLKRSVRLNIRSADADTGTVLALIKYVCASLRYRL